MYKFNEKIEFFLPLEKKAAKKLYKRQIREKEERLEKKKIAKMKRQEEEKLREEAEEQEELEMQERILNGDNVDDDKSGDDEGDKKTIDDNDEKETDDLNEKETDDQDDIVDASPLDVFIVNESRMNFEEELDELEPIPEDLEVKFKLFIPLICIFLWCKIRYVLT